MVKCNERIQLQKGKTRMISDSDCKTKGQRERETKRTGNQAWEEENMGRVEESSVDTTTNLWVNSFANKLS